MMDKVIIKDLLARGIIGISDVERSSAQDILINIELHGDLRRPGKSDSIEDCIDYSITAEKIQQYVEGAMRFTVEALAEDIAGLCLEEPRVERVIVRVEKPGAVRFTRSVGVEIDRWRPK